MKEKDNKMEMNIMVKKWVWVNNVFSCKYTET